jgi:hypothetical protein
MKQITITTSKATIIVCRLPENAYAIQVLNPMDLKPIIGWTDKVTLTLTPEYYGLPEGRWQLLGKASELTGNMYGNIVEPSKFYTHMWMNYEKPDSSHRSDQCRTVAESFSSLLSANGVLLSNPLGSEPQFGDYALNLVTEDDVTYDHESFYADLFAWQAAEEKVWRNPYVLVKSKP